MLFTARENDKKIYTVFPQIVSTLEQFLQQKISLLGKKLKFVATIQIFYFLQIQKSIVFAETIRGNTVIHDLKPRSCKFFGSTRSMALGCQYFQSIKTNSQTTAGAPVLNAPDFFFKWPRLK